MLNHQKVSKYYERACSFSLPSNSFNENSHKTKQLSSEEQQHVFITRLSYLLLQEILNLIQTHHQRSERNISMKNIYVGKLSKDITKEDICQLFSLN